MSLKIKDARPKIPPVSPGTYIGVCVGVIDVGEQYSERFKKFEPKIRFVWELSGQSVEVDGKPEPRILSKEVTNTSSSKGALRTMLVSWNGVNYSDEEFRAVRVADQIGKPAMLNVVLNESGEYANISAVIPVPQGFSVQPPVTQPILWDMDEWTDEGFAALPEWVRNRIMKSSEYKAAHLPETKVDFPETVDNPPQMVYPVPVSASAQTPSPPPLAAPQTAAPSGGVPF